jgi:hypothetical protein
MGSLARVAQTFTGLGSALLLINAGRQQAWRIYARAGFVQIGCCEGFFSPDAGVREDGIVMRRPLDDLRAIKLDPADIGNAP